MTRTSQIAQLASAERRLDRPAKEAQTDLPGHHLSEATDKALVHRALGRRSIMEMLERVTGQCFARREPSSASKQGAAKGAHDRAAHELASDSHTEEHRELNELAKKEAKHAKHDSQRIADLLSEESPLSHKSIIRDLEGLRDVLKYATDLGGRYMYALTSELVHVLRGGAAAIRNFFSSAYSKVASFFSRQQLQPKDSDSTRGESSAAITFAPVGVVVGTNAAGAAQTAGSASTTAAIGSSAAAFALTDLDYARLNKSLAEELAEILKRCSAAVVKERESKLVHEVEEQKEQRQKIAKELHDLVKAHPEIKACYAVQHALQQYGDPTFVAPGENLPKERILTEAIAELARREKPLFH